ncbi:hypothetical protein HOU00_gp279 [Caulobacter phage CcrPW]|uniref:Uncharacterized protein n=1 Tax=Caulobacter phage CcrPW TaxID=2283271 RepID=A0A385EAU6_9CAUD|nr:hypothetical protein HOU00_gp279 [Caulobacter phage CcrPW]AXQ68846.1 hypothetical protein CcrPW_gp307 [Caulobacter phage CcrPW]
MTLPPTCEALVTGLTDRSQEREIKAAIRAVAKDVPPEQHDKAFDRVRRACHMNRGTFKRLMKHATSRVDA